MITIDQQNDIAFPELLLQGIALLRQRRRIDDGRRDILRCSERRRDGDGWEDGLDVRCEGLADEGVEERGFAYADISRQAYPN